MNVVENINNAIQTYIDLLQVCLYEQVYCVNYFTVAMPNQVIFHRKA